jgi:hypothetical protein
MNTFFSTTTERLQRVTNRDQQSPDFTEAFSSFRAPRKKCRSFPPCLPPVYPLFSFPAGAPETGSNGVRWGASNVKVYDRGIHVEEFFHLIDDDFS